MGDAKVTELVVGTWNCFGQAQSAIDALAFRAPYGDRLLHEELPRTLAEAHVVCVQELFSRDAERFFGRLGDRRVRDDNAPSLRSATLRGSGLGVAARGVSLSSPTIERFSGAQVGWDRLARKGTMHVRVALDGLEIDVLTAHLQAGWDAAASKVRLQQIGELARRVRQHGSPDRPFVLCGDFNVCGLGGNGVEYVALRGALAGFEDLGAAEDLATFDPHPDRNTLAHDNEPELPRMRLDYVFFRPARGLPFRVRKLARLFDRPIEGITALRSMRHGRPLARAFASDHFGLAATIELGAVS